MRFSGKKFRRTGASNLDEFFKASKTPEQIKEVFTSNAPIWCYTLLDNRTLHLQVQTEQVIVTRVFPLGVELPLPRVKDGQTGYMTFTLEGDNVLKQKIRQSNGTIINFRREFYERTATMTITNIQGTDVRKAHIFYEVVD